MAQTGTIGVTAETLKASSNQVTCEHIVMQTLPSAVKGTFTNLSSGITIGGATGPGDPYDDPWEGDIAEVIYKKGDGNHAHDYRAMQVKFEE